MAVAQPLPISPVRPAWGARGSACRPARGGGRPAAAPALRVVPAAPQLAPRPARPVATRPTSAGSPAGRPAPLRLTRRGRAVVRLAVGLALALVVVAAVLLIVRPAHAGESSHPMSVRHHVVMPGETLLQIAAEEVPGVDPRDTVVRIVELNALPGSGIQAGQDLALPDES